MTDLTRTELCRAWAERGERINFSVQHIRFIDAVCDGGMTLQDAAVAVEPHPERATNLRRMMLAIAVEERGRQR